MLTEEDFRRQTKGNQAEKFTILNPADLKKMYGYVQYLEQKGAGEEKAGSYIEAIGTFLKLVDVLLVLGDAVPTYPEWVKCTTSASNYQKKVKSLIALASLKQKQEEQASFAKPPASPIPTVTLTKT
jgi:hypothetical protein